jgi:hypothetical protein
MPGVPASTGQRALVRVGQEVPDIVEERRGDEGFGGAGHHGLPRGLKRMLRLRDALHRVVGSGAGVVRRQDRVDDHGHLASPAAADAGSRARPAARVSEAPRSGRPGPAACENLMKLRTFTAKRRGTLPTVQLHARWARVRRSSSARLRAVASRPSNRVTALPTYATSCASLLPVTARLHSAFRKAAQAS